MSNGNGLASVAPLAPLSTPSLRLGGRLVTHAGTFVVKLLGACRQGFPSRKKADDPHIAISVHRVSGAPSDTGVAYTEKKGLNCETANRRLCARRRGPALPSEPEDRAKNPRERRAGMNLRLEGKRALVTGSSSGIGEGIAHALAEEGVAVVVHGRSQERAQRVASEIAGRGGKAF